MSNTCSIRCKEVDNVLSLSHEDAKKYFLKSENYCNLQLPLYFNFEKLLDNVFKEVDGRKFSEIGYTFTDVKNDTNLNTAKSLDNVNLKLVHNKDGKLAWRMFELIHPVIYTYLVSLITSEDNWKIITDRFKYFSSEASKIKCMSIPVVSKDENRSDKSEQILSWWCYVEQRSLELSLLYDYVYTTDVTDCYGSIYTHSIAWALHSRKVSKNNMGRGGPKLLGDSIDTTIANMTSGQTNGIPQGSTLMDFVAEMVLGYADLLLNEKIEESQITDYEIIRYRDDYSVFVNKPSDGEKIIRLLSEVMISLGLKLNAQKTVSFDDVIEGSIKKSKVQWISRKQFDKDVQKHLLIIYQYSKEYPNSGSLCRALTDFSRRIKKIVSRGKLRNVEALIGIITKIAVNNPKVYPHCSEVLATLLCCLKQDDDVLAETMFTYVIFKFLDLPHSILMNIWLQRVSLGIDIDGDFKDDICELIEGGSKELWNSEWVKLPAARAKVDSSLIFDQTEIDKLTCIFSDDEVSLFPYAWFK